MGVTPGICPAGSQHVRNIGSLADVMRRPSLLLLAVSLTVGLVGAPQWVQADGVAQAEARLQAVQAELDDLANEMGQLDEDYGAAMDRKDQLDAEIVTSQAKVDEMGAQLGDVEQLMQDMAVARFTSGGSLALSPLFSDPASYNEAEQRDALSGVALDMGEASADDLQALYDDFTNEKDRLQRKQDEVAGLIATLEQKQAQYTELEAVYRQKVAAAEQEFGAAKLQAEADRRAAAAAAAARRNQNNSGGGGGSTSPGRGGGGGGGGGGGYVVPPPSGRAGVAVSAAYSQLGVRYRFAAESPGVAFDCSGLTKWAWGQAGVYLPHQSGAQYRLLPHVPQAQVQPGDLLFYKAPIGHVAIYVGGGQLIHAPAAGDVVKLAAVNWSKVVGIGRPG